MSDMETYLKILSNKHFRFIAYASGAISLTLCVLKYGILSGLALLGASLIITFVFLVLILNACIW